jgi:hypothetical protein
LGKRDEEIVALKAQVAERDARLKNPIPEDTQKELESLRQFRAKLDVEADPNFHIQFDGKIEQSQQFVYSQLSAAGFSQEAVDQIKSIGLERVDWEPLLEKMSPQTQRLVQARLDDIAVTKFDKERKLEEAKTNISEYIKVQRDNYSKRGQQHQEETEAQLQEFMAKLEFLQDPEPLKTTATKEERAVFSANETHRKNIIDSLAEAKRDDSPYMRALLIAGMGQLLNLKPRFEQLVEYSKAQDAKLTKALGWIDKVKAAGKPRSKEGSAEPTPPKPGVDYTQTAGDSLDSLRKAYNV